jgi:hypothetical protein
MKITKEGNKTSHKFIYGCVIISAVIGFVGYNVVQMESNLRFTTAELATAEPQLDKVREELKNAKEEHKVLEEKGM